MSHAAIWEVSKFLKQLLVEGLAGDTNTAIPSANLLLTNPGQPAAGAGDKRMYLWLYQVMQNEHMRNDGFVRQTRDEELRFTPLALNLQYLLTPSTGGDETDQLVLGRAMQILYDNAVVAMPSSNPPRSEELHIALTPRGIEELAEVWEAMNQPYRLSVCYEVRAVRIDSQRLSIAGRVSERRTTFESVQEGA